MSIVVVQPTAMALEAIADLELHGDEHEVVVVAAHSESVSQRVGSFAVRNVAIDANAAMATARNAGAEAARGEYLAFLGADAVPDARWVSGALGAFRADARVAIVASTVEGAEAAHDVLGATEAGSVVETRVFHWVGEYDEQCVGVEDLDLGWRVWRAGMRVIATPASAVRVPMTARIDPQSGGFRAMITKNLAPDTRTEDPHSVVRTLELAPLLEPVLVQFAAPATRVLVITPDVLAPQMAGPAIRAYELARVLADSCAVELVSTVRCDLTDADIAVCHADGAALKALVARSDVLVVQGHVLDHHPWIVDSDRVVVVDAYDPIQFEVLEHSRDLPNGQRRMEVRHANDTVARLLARGDHFLVASAKQRDLLIGQLAAAGRINAATYDGDESLSGLIGIVPFGIPDNPPVASSRSLRGKVPGIGDDDAVILWGGGVYNWFDPLTLLRAIDGLRVRVPNVRLFFMGMQHPHPDVPEMEMARRTRELARELGLFGTHVFFNEDWVPYHDRTAYLLDADVGVSTHLDHVETAFSYRTRILDYLWAALPVVATSGDAIADSIVAHGFGLIVPPNDPAALEDALFVLLTDADRNQACRAAISAARSELVWSRATADLVAMCALPRRAADLVDPRERALHGDRAAAAVWGFGWRNSARGAIAHLRRGEFDDLTRKARARWAGLR